MEAPPVAPGVPADYYERIQAADEDNWWYRGSRAIELALLGGRLRQGGRLLDAGCGPGGHLRWAADSGLFTKLAGVDLGSQAVDLARRRVPDAELHAAPLHRLPFPDHSFDVIALHDVLQHIHEDDLSSSLAEIRRVLAITGALIVRTNGALRFRRARADWRLYDRRTLRHTLEDAGLRCERLTYANMLPSLFAAARGRSPQPPTAEFAGVPQLDRSPVRARLGTALLRAEARYLQLPRTSLPYGHSLWALATRRGDDGF
jgi:SAM-dependent methyltransferase